MKILYDATQLSYYNEKSGHRAGVFVVSLNIFRELKKRKDIEITFFCNFQRYYFMKELVENCDEFKGVHLLEENSPINKFFGFLNYCVRNFSKRCIYAVLILSRCYENLCYVKNKKNVEQLKEFDLYFSPFSPPSGEIMDSNLKRFRMLHDIIPIMENGGNLPAKPSMWCYRLYNNINDSDFYVTNSESTRKDFLKTFSFIKEENIKNAYLGANEYFEPTKSNDSEKYILSLCTVGKRKNILFGIKTFYKFIEKHNISDLKLYLAGSVWKKFEKELNFELRKYDKTKLKLLGYVDEKDLANLYTNALCFIYPSLYEGFGLPVLEAMQCGCPVITSNISSLPEVIGDAGIQINPQSEGEMIEAYEKMYFNADFRNECIQKGIDRAKLFSWEKCAEEIVDFIESKI